MSTENKKTDNILDLILYALPLAFGVVITILSILPFFGLSDPIVNGEFYTLMGIGLFCLALEGLISSNLSFE